MVWGTGGSGGIQSCDSLLKRVEANDPALVELILLPMKNFGAEEVERLAKVIADGTNTALKTITASGHAITPASSSTLAAAIAEASSQRRAGDIEGPTGITVVAIGDETMGDEGISAFCKPLEGGNGCGLEVLDFSLKHISKDGMVAINRAFGCSTALRRLHIYRNTSIGDDGIEALCRLESSSDDSPQAAATVSLFPVLDYLDLSDCEIGEAGVRYLVNGLMSGNGCCDADGGKEYRRRNPIDLTLNQNKIGPDGCHHLAQMMTINEPAPTLTETIGGRGLLTSLKLQNCAIGDEGLCNLLRVMISTSCLDLLDLTGNGITGGGSLVKKPVINALVGLNLKELCLAHNPIGVEGIMALALSLETSSSSAKAFDLLDLTDTRCGIEGALAIIQCRGVSFNTLRLFNNALGFEGGFESLATCYSTTKDEDNKLHHSPPSIVNLDVGGNRASETSVVSFLYAILSVAAVDLGECESDGQQSSRLPLQLRTLEIGGNMVGESVERTIKELNVAMPELDVVRDKVKSA